MEAIKLSYTNDKYMEQMKYDVFISYSRKDYIRDDVIIPHNPITAILELIDKNNISYWFDKEGIYSGQEFIEVISNAIANSKMLVFVSSMHSNASMWTAGEVFEALDGEKLIIPVRIDDSPYNKKFKMLVRPLDYVDFQEQPKTALPQLLRAVLNEKERLAKIEKEEQLRLIEKQKEAKKEAVRKEIKEKAKEYLALSGQQDYILKELYTKNKFIGNTTKRCLVCEKEVQIESLFCDQCGWQFPKLYGIDGSDVPLHDESHLAIARTNWQSLSRIVDLQNESQKLESISKELEDTKKDYEKKMCYQEKSIEDLSNQCQKQKEHINEKEEELASLQKSISSLSMQLDLSKQEVSQKEKQVQNNQNIILSLKERIESLTKDISQYKQNIQKKEEQIEKQIKEYKLLEDKYYQLIKGTTTTTIPKDTNIDQKTSSTAKEATVQNATPTLKKSIKSLDEAFSIIETCCNTSPIQDNYDFNRAKLSLNWMINILGKKYGLYVSKNAILACKNIGELKHLLYNSSNKNGNQ